MRNQTGVVISGGLPQLHSDSWFESPVVIQAKLAPMNLIQIGAFTGIFGGKIGHCRIGRYCSIAPDCNIAPNEHPIGWLSTSMVQYVPNVHGWGDWLESMGEMYFCPEKKYRSSAQVTIGNDVWIGQGAFVKSGIVIGDGAVIAAHSVVVEDVPPYMIVAGVPAKRKRLRFSEDMVDRLLKIKWWDYNVMQFEGLDFSDVSRAVAVIEEGIEAGGLSKMVLRKWGVAELL